MTGKNRRRHRNLRQNAPGCRRGDVATAESERKRLKLPPNTERRFIEPPIPGAWREQRRREERAKWLADLNIYTDPKRDIQDVIAEAAVLGYGVAKKEGRIIIYDGAVPEGAEVLMGQK